MNIDDIMNENIEEVVRVSVVERVHLPESEKDPEPETPEAEAAKAVTEVKKAADEAVKAATEAGETVTEAAKAVEETVDEEPVAILPPMFGKKKVSAVKKAAAEEKKVEAETTKAVSETKAVEAEVKKAVSETKAVEAETKKAADDRYIDDDDDDDDDEEYVVHNAFSEDGRKIASAIGAGVKAVAEPDDDDAFDGYDEKAFDEPDDEAFAMSDEDELSGDDDLEGSEKRHPVQEKQSGGFFKWILSELLFIIPTLAFFLLLFYIFPPYVVKGPSMLKTLDNNAFGFGYRYATPQRGDIVIVNTGVSSDEKGTNGEFFIKRVIGVPGDTIKCAFEQYDYDVTMSDGTVVKAGGNVYRVYLNGELQIEPYVWFGGGSFARVGEWTLGEGEYFVMGDNRFDSNDSRAFGPIKRSDIKCTMKVFLYGRHDPE